MDTIDIYTDGGCHGISGRGGWAAMIYDGPRPVEISGYETDTTNQMMELRAAIEGLGYLEQPSQVRLYSDSAYLTNGMKQRWYLKQEQNGWKTANKKPVKNAELWEEVVRLSRHHTVEWIKVNGHAGIPANERCDAPVRLEMARGLGQVQNIYGILCSGASVMAMIGKRIQSQVGARHSSFSVSRLSSRMDAG